MCDTSLKVSLDVQVIVIRFTSKHVKADLCLQEMMQCMPGVHFMAHRYVICFVDLPGLRDNNARRSVCSALQCEVRSAWPVCQKLDDVIQVRTCCCLLRR